MAPLIHPLTLLMITMLMFTGCAECDRRAEIEVSNKFDILSNSDVPDTWPKGFWRHHTIDDSSLGADGTRFGDINGDGLLDITTPWEQGGIVRVYINPGNKGLKDPWPQVTAGEVGDPEDSFFVDLDGDGHLDVVSACEGKTQSMFVHWAPTDRSKLLNPAAWTTKPIPFNSDAVRWMYAFAMQIDGKAGVDIVAASKYALQIDGKAGIEDSAVLGWFQSPENSRDMASWRRHRLLLGTWFMTLRPSDIDKDGDLDIVTVEEKGPYLAKGYQGKELGVIWYENPAR